MQELVAVREGWREARTKQNGEPDRSLGEDMMNQKAGRTPVHR